MKTPLISLLASAFLALPALSAPPANDHFENAINLGSKLEGTATGTNLEATTQKPAGEPGTKGGSSYTATVWWKWTAPASGNLSLDSEGTAFNNRHVGLHTGSTISSLTTVAGGFPNGGILSALVEQGITYYFQIGGDNSFPVNQGTVQLNYSLIPSGDISPPPTSIAWIATYNVPENELLLDTDGDGLLGWQEARFGTDPHDATSAVPLTMVAESPLTSFRLSFPTVPGIRYQLRSSANLSDWENTGSPILGDGAPFSLQDIPVDPAAPTEFWQIAAEEPLNSDSDSLDDYEEFLLGSDPTSDDTDGDTLKDDDEFLTHGTSPTLTDTDRDGRPDPDEVANGGNPTVSDAVAITSINPTDGEGMVSVTREITVRFDGQPDPSTIDATSFTVLANGAAIPGHIRPSSTGKFVTFIPQDPLPASTEIRVYLNGERIRDAEGYPVDLTQDGAITEDDAGLVSTEFRTLPLTRLPGTEVWGFVKDSETGTPIVGATIRVDAFPAANAVTDADGRFVLTDMPAPEFFVHIDGSTATSLPEGFTYPNVGKPFHSIPGTSKQISVDGEPFDIFLPKLKLTDIQPLSMTETTQVGFGEDGKARLQQMFPDTDPTLWDEMQVTIAPGAAVDSNGTPAQTAAIIPVDPDKLPGPLPQGLEPGLVISIQAPGANSFDVPAAVTFPNINGELPGTKLALLSFDHAAGMWIHNGSATVSVDGRTIVTDQGTGVVAPGWHIFERLRKVYRCLKELKDLETAFDALAAVVGCLSNVTEQAEQALVALKIIIKEADAVRDLVRDVKNAAERGDSRNAILGVLAGIELVKVAIEPAIEVAASKTTVAIDAILIAIDCANSVLTQLEKACRRIQDSEACRTVNLRVLCDGIQVARDLSKSASLIAQAITKKKNELIKQLAFFVICEVINELKKRYSSPEKSAGDSARPEGNTEALADMTEAELISLLDAHSEIFYSQSDDLSKALLSGTISDTGDPIIGTLYEDLESVTRRYRVAKNSYFLLEQNQFETRGRTDQLGGFPQELSIAPDAPFSFLMFEPETRRISRSIIDATSGFGDFVLSPAEFLSEINPVHSDSDSLSDLVESIIGTSPTNPDTDGDGISDSAELDQGLNPLDGISYPTGVIASLPLLGSAKEVCVEGDTTDPRTQTAYVATGSHGLALVDVSDFTNPAVLGQVDLAGDCTDVAVDPVRMTAAVAANDGGLHLVDTSDALLPGSFRTLPIFANQVELSNGLIYASQGSRIIVADYLSGFILQSVEIAEGDDIQGMSRLGSTLFSMDAAGTLRSFDISGFQISELDSLSLIHGAGKIFASNGTLFAAAPKNDRGGFSTIDISDPASLTLISNSDVASPLVAPRTAAIANGSGLALLVGSRQGNHTLDVMDVSDPGDTNDLLTRYPLSSAPESIAIASGIALVATGDSGLQIVNYRDFDINGIPPSISITSSATDLDPDSLGVQVYERSVLPISLTLTDDVQVRNVEILINGETILNDVTAPFGTTITAPAPETEEPFTIEYRATDTGGNIAISNTLTFTSILDERPATFIASAPLHNSFTTSLNNILLFFSHPIQTIVPSEVILNFLGEDGIEGDSDDSTIPVSQTSSLSQNRISISTEAPPKRGIYRLVIEEYDINLKINVVDDLSEVGFDYRGSNWRYKIVANETESRFYTGNTPKDFTAGAAPFGSPASCGNPFNTLWNGNSDLLLRKDIYIPESNTATFGFAVDNDMRVWINGKEITSGWYNSEGCPREDELLFTFTNSPNNGVLVPGRNSLAIRVRDRGAPAFFNGLFEQISPIK